MALPNPSVADWRPGQVGQNDQTDETGVARMTTIWEDTRDKGCEGHQVKAVSAGDLDNPPARVKLTDEDVSMHRNPQGDIASYPLSPDDTNTKAQNKRICRKTDKVILSILVWVYFLQVSETI